MEETKIIYHIDEEETPYLIKLTVPPDRVTLGDFKTILNRPNFKYFFKSMDDDFGVVKEEISDDNAKLPCFNGRVVSWLVTAEGSSVSDTTSQCTDTMSQRSDIRIPHERSIGIGDSRPPSFHSNLLDQRDMLGGGDTTCTETESVVSSRRDPFHHRQAKHKHYHDGGSSHHNGHSMKDHPRHLFEASSMMTSDIETTSFLDSEDETVSRYVPSRISTTTEDTSVSRINRHRRRRRKHRMPPMSRTSSISSITDSTMSLNIITVSLNLDTVNFLGISIVGQSNKGGDGGIYVGSIMKGGAVALDGRIEPGDMILQVNDVNFENMSNDDAVRVLRESVQKPGPIKLVVAKCWDPNPKGYFTIPRTEPIRPIDPGAWVAHTEAIRASDHPLRPPSRSTLTSTSSSITSSIPESERPYQDFPLNLEMGMTNIVKAMATPDSGLDVRDRMWLKITIHSAFIGADVVDWLHSHVQGFSDRREARKYATQMLKEGLIRHTVNKITFSEQCYYVFGELCSGIANMRLEDDAVSEADRDTLAPLPPPTATAPWSHTMPPYTGTYVPPTSTFLPFSYSNDVASSFNNFSNIGGGSSFIGPVLEATSVHSVCSVGEKIKDPSPTGSESELSRIASRVATTVENGSSGSERSAKSSRSIREVFSLAPALSGSKQSFHMAMGNPCEFYVDVM